MPVIGLSYLDSRFNLDIAAIAGFFGGKETISAMAVLILFEDVLWLGWCNSPGSYKIAEHFGMIASSRFWDGFFPGTNDLPAASFGLDGKKGPEYIAAFSKTITVTGHLAYLMMKWSKELETVQIKERVTKPCYVTYLAMKHVDYNTPVKQLPLRGAFYGLIPITGSVVSCIICVLIRDWFSFSMIFLGIICSGLATLVIGKGRLVIKSVSDVAPGAPPGHGLLKGEEDIVVIKGEERDVNAITKGRFDLETDPERGDEEQGAVRSYHAIGVCSLLLRAQFLAQLLLVPQGHLFGQIMFIVSLVMSWGYNLYLSSLEKEKIQASLLVETLGKPEMRRFRIGTRTEMVVLACLLLFHDDHSNLPEEEQRRLRVKVLDSFLPNNTFVRTRWTNKVVDQLLNINLEDRILPFLEHEQKLGLPAQDEKLSEDDTTLLNEWLDGAAAAFRGYFDICGTLPH